MWPACEFLWRVQGVLHSLNDNGLCATGNLKEPLHTQDAVAPRYQQSFEPCFEIFPISRFIPAEPKVA